MKGKKTGGRVKKNNEGKRIFHTPSQQALDHYNAWDEKAKNLDLAIINYRPVKNIEK